MAFCYRLLPLTVFSVDNFHVVWLRHDRWSVIALTVQWPNLDSVRGIYIYTFISVLVVIKIWVWGFVLVFPPFQFLLFLMLLLEYVVFCFCFVCIVKGRGGPADVACMGRGVGGQGGPADVACIPQRKLSPTMI